MSHYHQIAYNHDILVGTKKKQYKLCYLYARNVKDKVSGKLVRLLGETVGTCTLCISRRCAGFTGAPSDPRVSSMWSGPCLISFRIIVCSQGRFTPIMLSGES